MLHDKRLRGMVGLKQNFIFSIYWFIKSINWFSFEATFFKGKQNIFSAIFICKVLEQPILLKVLIKISQNCF